MPVADTPAHRQLVGPEEAVRNWVASGQPEWRTTIARQDFPALMDAVAEGLPDGLQASVGLTHGAACPCAQQPRRPVEACRCAVLAVRLQVHQPVGPAAVTL